MKKKTFFLLLTLLLLLCCGSALAEGHTHAIYGVVNLDWPNPIPMNGPNEPKDFTISLTNTNASLSCSLCYEFNERITLPSASEPILFHCTEIAFPATCEGQGTFRFESQNYTFTQVIDGVEYQNLRLSIYLSSPVLGHDWSNKDGVCARSGCGKVCDHSMTASQRRASGGAVMSAEPTVAPPSGGGTTTNTHFPTCTQSAVCDICGKTLPALGHRFNNYVSNNDATCEADGTKTAHCDNKGCTATDTKPDTGSALGHRFNNYVSNNDATCEADGTKTAHCDNKGCTATDTKPDTDSALGHRFNNYVSNNDATCEADGTKTAHCDNKGCTATDTKPDTDSALGHSFTKYVSNNDATCEEDGTMTAPCDHQGCEKTNTLPEEGSALGHDDHLEITPPRCGQKGYTTYTCIRCGRSYTADETPALHHIYGEWTPDGEQKSSALCVRCNRKALAACSMLSFTMKAADASAEALPFSLCPVCGAITAGQRLSLIKEARAVQAHSGVLTVRTGELVNGARVITVAAVRSGHPLQPVGPLTISLPAALANGCSLSLLSADGTETALACTVENDLIFFTLDFADADGQPVPAQVIRLLPD